MTSEEYEVVKPKLVRKASDVAIKILKRESPYKDYFEFKEKLLEAMIDGEASYRKRLENPNYGPFINKYKKEKTSMRVRTFDKYKIIIDPDKLIPGKQYYADNIFANLKELFEADEYTIFANAYGNSPIDKYDKHYAFWYPRDPLDYSPYSFEDLGTEGLSEFINKTIVRKKDSKKYKIIYIVYEPQFKWKLQLSNFKVISSKDLFDNYTWENGNPCGDYRNIMEYRMARMNASNYANKSADLCNANKSDNK